MNPWRRRDPTIGLKITASTAANVSGSTISLTAPSAVTTMIAATTNPTKLQAQTPSLGIQRMNAGASLGPVSRGAAGSRSARPSDWPAAVAGPRDATSTSGSVLTRSTTGESLLEGQRGVGQVEADDAAFRHLIRNAMSSHPPDCVNWRAARTVLGSPGLGATSELPLSGPTAVPRIPIVNGDSGEEAPSAAELDASLLDAEAVDPATSPRFGESRPPH